jgi:transposase
MSRIEVLSEPERRRRWSAEQKRSIVAEAFAPGASVCELARRVDLVPSLIYRWRQELRSAAAGFSEVVVAPEPSERTVAAPAALVIELGRDIRVRNWSPLRTRQSSPHSPIAAHARQAATTPPRRQAG